MCVFVSGPATDGSMVSETCLGFYSTLDRARGKYTSPAVPLLLENLPGVERSRHGQSAASD